MVRFGVFLVPALAVGLAMTACVDKEKCAEAVRVTRDALSKDQPDLARQWRDRAWKICNDPTLTTPLDKEIVDKEAELAKHTADMAAQVAAAAQQRMNTSTTVWKAFSKLPPKDQTEATLQAYRAKTDRMSQGLPPEYAKQVDDYNASQQAQAQKLVAAAAKTAATR
jgi:hypothetical protein